MSLPSAVKTDALASVLTPEIETAMLKNTPLARLGDPKDIAYAALFLCSPAAGWISGQRRRRLKIQPVKSKKKRCP